MKLAPIILLLLSLNLAGAELPHNFVKAIHQVETSGRYGAIKGDNGKALGPLQIHESYWKDSKVSGSYTNCVNYDYSVRVMTAYLNRYGSRFIERQDWVSLARIHNGGPNGYHHASTLEYARKFKKEFDKASNHK